MFIRNFIRTICFVFMFPLLGYVAEIKEAPEKTYKRAIAFRNEKTEGSLYQAETLFLQLSDIEHPKKAYAQHNYASLQYQKKNYELAYDYFIKAGLEASKGNCARMLEDGLIKQDLYLVVGSDREAGMPPTGVFSTMHGLDVDMSHANTFEGKATTMDLHPSCIAGAKHLVGNAQTFDFEKKYNIRHAFLERLPTSPDASIMSGRDSGAIRGLFSENIVGLCIEQISKAMRSGAILDIEWDPYLTLWSADEAVTADCIRKNPFQGFFELNVALQSVVLLHGDVNPLTADILTRALALSEKVREKLEFYHQQGASDTYEQLLRKVYWEVRIIQNMCGNNSMVHLGCDLQKDSIDNFVAAAQSAFFENFPKRSVGKRVRVVVQGEPERIGIVYSVPTFLQSSVLNFILSKIAAENNSPYAKTYLESVGFADVSIASGTNIHNGRNNVWMIHAVKA